MHGKPDMVYPVKVEQSYARPAWPVGVRWTPKDILSTEISMVIDTDGVPQDFCILAIDPDQQEIAEAAVDAARRWRYSPATSEGKPVPAIVTFKLKFDPEAHSAGSTRFID
jgi:hypothetical protein